MIRLLNSAQSSSKSPSPVSIYPPLKQTRTSQSTSIAACPPSSQYLTRPLNSHKPRSQMEALPPAFASKPPQIYDPATRHPVFFTSALRRPPFPLPDGACAVVNPVAWGYVWEEAARTAREGLVKL